MNKKHLSLAEKYKYLKRLVSIMHGKINISGGYILEHEIFKVIRDSNKHDEVYEGYPIKLIDKGKRKKHKVDIITIDKDIVVATNSKSKSWNSTDSEDAKLNDVKHFRRSIQTTFPNKKVVYQFLKDEYVFGKIALYDYFVENGIPVYNTEDYLIEHYGIDFDALEERRQRESLRRCEEALKHEGVDTVALYETRN